MMFNAREFKAAWSNARLACSTDETRIPINSLLVEIFKNRGIRIVTTNSYVLIDTFIHCLPHEVERPDLDVDPDETIVVYDPANGFTAPCAGADTDTLVRLEVVKTEGHRGLQLLSTHRAAPMMSTVVEPEGNDYPGWRGLWPTPTEKYEGEQPTFSPKWLALAARLFSSLPPAQSRVELYGIDHLKPWLFLNPHSPHRLLVMPIRKKSL